MKPIIDISYWQNPRNIDYDKLCAAADGIIKFKEKKRQTW